MNHSVFVWLSLLLAGLGFYACNQEPMLCTGQYPDGKIKYEVPCDPNTGVYQGEYLEYHRSGKLWKRKFYVDDLEEDTTRFFFYKTGQTLKSIPMRKGKRHGLSQEYRDDGTLKEAVEYIKGVKKGRRITYYPDGVQVELMTTHNDGGVLHGPYASYQTSGQPYIKGNYWKALRDSAWTYFYEEGAPLATVNYDKGQYQGPFSVLYPTGDTMVQGQFLAGLVDGKIRLLDEQGKVLQEDPWKFGVNLAKKFPQTDPNQKLENRAMFKVADRIVFIQPDTVWIQ